MLLYPTISNLMSVFRQTKIVEDYTDSLSELSDESIERMWAEARAYNQELKQYNGRPYLTQDQMSKYLRTLDVTGTGVMGYIEIPSINIRMPIYHDTDEAVLQIAAGHLNWTSLPVGGEGTHCVLTGHRGLPRARLFTDIPQLRRGDVFYICVLNRTLTYTIERISTVQPTDLSKLKPVPGHDYCTLVTCTPYRLNTHRLLITGSMQHEG